MADYTNRSDDSVSGVEKGGLEKGGVLQHDVAHESDLGAVNSRDTAMMHLTEEELAQEKILRRKIDSVIMPMVVLVRSLALDAA